MSSPRDIQTQLRSLSIGAEQRPTDARGGRKWLIVFIVLLAAGVGAVGFVYRDRIMDFGRDVTAKAAPAKVETITVRFTEPPGASPVLTATGKIVSDHIVSVATKVSGQIVSLHFEQGDSVEEGQPLAHLEDVRYRARRNEAAAHLARSKANLEFQKTNYARVKELLERQSAPDIEFADAKRGLDEAEAQVNADQATLDFAQKALNDCEVTAPISGVILERNVEVGDFVAAEGGLGANANARFAIIADMTKLRVEVDVSELDIARLHEDMPCKIVPDAYKDRTYDGHIMWIDPGANYSKATVQVKVRITNPDDFLRVEGSAKVTFLPEATERPTDTQSAIWIPTTAIVEEDGATSVFAVTDGRLRRQPIDIAERTADQAKVVSGLSAGQQIAADATGLVNGQRIGS